MGKTRKGFGRVDRTEISSPEICLNCGSQELSEVINLHRQQVASLVAEPIEVVEYPTQSCKCLECGAVVRGEQALGIFPSQDLSVNLQALLPDRGIMGIFPTQSLRSCCGNSERLKLESEHSKKPINE